MTKISSKTGIVNRDDIQINPATTEDKDIIISESAKNFTLLRMLMQSLRPLAKVLTGRPYLAVDIANTPAVTVSSGTVTTVTTVTTVATVSNQTNIGGLNAFAMQYNNARTAWNTGLRANVTFI